MEYKTVAYIFTCIICLVLGMYIGAVLHQEHINKGFVQIAEALKGSEINIEIDINETEMIKGISEVFMLILNQTLNNMNTTK